MDIVVGIDLRASHHHDLVARAGLYAQRLGGRVSVLNVASNDGEAAAREEPLQQLLQTLPTAIRGTVRIEIGAPADGLISASANAHVLVVGSRAPPVLERLIKGSMASRILRRAHCPVLVFRSERPLTHPRLLVGVDLGNSHPAVLLSLIAPLAIQLGASVDAVYAEESVLPHVSDPAFRERIEREWNARRAPSRDRLEDLLRANLPAAQCGQGLVQHGEPADVLAALSKDYDVVCVGNRDRVGLAWLLLGTVAENVVSRASCDVISLPMAQQIESNTPSE